MHEVDPKDDLFQPRLDDLLNHSHELFRLSKEIDWDGFCEEFGKLYCPDNGRPGIPIRVVVGLLYLKHMFNDPTTQSTEVC